MSNFNGGTMLVLWIFYAIVIFVLYWKSVLIVFDSFRAVMQSFIVSAIGGILFVGLTLYFWKAAAVIAIIIGILFALKASSGGGKVLAIIIAVVMAIVIVIVGSDMKKNNPKTPNTETAHTDVQNSSNSGEDDLYQDSAMVEENSNTDEYIAGNMEIPAEALAQLGKEDLEYLINEMYARHGYIFTSDTYKQLFSSFDWYKPATDDMAKCEAEFNDYERKNLKTFTDYAKSQGWR